MLDDLARVECLHPVAAIAKAEHAESRPSHQAQRDVGLASARVALEAARSRTTSRASLPASPEIVHQLATSCRVPDSAAYTREKQGQQQYLPQSNYLGCGRPILSRPSDFAGYRWETSM